MADLNVLPLGSYDILIGMDWFEKHWSLINCKTKTINYQDEKRERQEMEGIQKALQIRPITTSQLAKCIRKGFQIYAIQVGFIESKDKFDTFENIPVVHNFSYIFPEEILALPPKRDINFTIELIPGVSLVS